MSESIYDAFCTLLNAFVAGQSPAVPVIYPGLEETPPSTGLWLEVKYIPAETGNYGTGNSGPQIYSGAFRIGVSGRPPVSLIELLGLADELVAAFPKGTTFGGVRLDQKPSVGGHMSHDERVVVPVTIRYRG